MIDGVAGSTSALLQYVPNRSIRLWYPMESKLTGNGQALLWVISCAVIGWSDIHPLLPVVIASFASALNAFPFQVSHSNHFRSKCDDLR